MNSSGPGGPGPRPTGHGRSDHGSRARRFRFGRAHSERVGYRVNEYGASLGVSSWELDLWGKYRNKAASARADLLSTEAARDAVRLSVAGNTAKTYFQLRSAALQEQTAEPGAAHP